MHLFWPKYRFCENYLNIGPVAWVQTATTYIQKDILKLLFGLKRHLRRIFLQKTRHQTQQRSQYFPYIQSMSEKVKKVTAIKNFLLTNTLNVNRPLK